MFTLGYQRTRVPCKSSEALLTDLHATRVPSFPNAYLPTFESAVGGGVMTPTLDCCGGGVIARGDLFAYICTFLTILKHISLIHRILNERETSHLHQDYLYLYKNKDIFMY